MQHHFVVYFDDVTRTWHVDTETTDARFDDVNVWSEDAEWEEWNDNTSEALNTLIDLLEVDSESVVTWVCPLCLRGKDCSCVQCSADSEDEWLDNDLIEETDYLEEDDE